MGEYNARIFRLVLLALLSVSLFSCAGLAVSEAQKDFTVEYTKVDNVISLNESARFRLEITNNLDIASDFLIYSGQVRWEVATDPYSDRQVTVGPQQSEEVIVTVEPKQDFWPNLYGITAKVKNVQSRQVERRDLLVQIKGNETQLEGSYLPAVQSDVEVPEKVDPREGIPITLALSNQNGLDIDTIAITLESGLFYREYETSLVGFESKELEYLIEVDDLTPPQRERITAKIRVPMDNETYNFRAQSGEFRVEAYGEVEETVNVSESLLKEKRHVLLKNRGNIERSYAYSVPKGFFSPLFFSADPSPKEREINGSYYYVWQGSLDVKGEQQVRITYNYRWLVYVAVVLLAAVILYFTLRSPLVITKHAYISKRDGGNASELTIQVCIKNRTNRPLYDLEVKDRLPNILGVRNQFDVGTLAPKKILQHEDRGTILKWDLDEFERFEERILAYRATLQLSVMGELSLPRAVCKFKKERIGKRMYAHSDVFRMNFDT